jgi:Kef-type K+ transport system membrane component KefB
MREDTSNFAGVVFSGDPDVVKLDVLFDPLFVLFTPFFILQIGMSLITFER